MNGMQTNVIHKTDRGSLSARRFFSELNRLTLLLKQRYPQSAEWEIKEIFKKITGKRPIDFIVEDHFPGDKEFKAIETVVIKRLSSEPIAHLLGSCEFMEYEFYVNNQIFIPRPETELLVAEAVAAAQNRFSDVEPLFAVDLGTGSGCIAVSFALRAMNWKILAFDSCEHAVACARKNVQTHNLSSRIVVEKQDYFDVEWSDEVGFKPHLIMANPPYIAQHDFNSLPEEVKKEPYQALIGGKMGFEIPEKILHLSVRRLAPRGLLVMEIGADQSKVLKDIAEQVGLSVVRMVQDDQQHDRIMIFEVKNG